MKKIFSLILASMLTVSAVVLTSCGETETTGNESNDNAANTVSVTITNALDDTVLLEALVDYEENMTVLDATIIACAANGVSYEIDEETSELISLGGLVDFLHADDTEEENQWLYTLNGKDVSATDGYTYKPSENVIAAGDAIAWEYDAAVVE